MTAARPLSPNELAFVDQLLSQPKHDAGAAYLHVYKCSKATARTSGAKMLARSWVKAEIARRKKERNVEQNLSVTDLLQELRNVVTADPRELMEYRRGACRFCHGFGHRYQRTPNEYRIALEAYKANNIINAKAGLAPLDPLGASFDTQGGIGYNPTVKPHKGCPECFGNGEGYSYVKDSRTVSKAAARLYAGIKETTAGVEIKTRAVDKSVHLLMQNMGMLEPDPDKGKETPAQKAAAVRELLQQAGATVGRPK